MIRQAATKVACYGLTVLAVLGFVAWHGLRLGRDVDPPVVATTSTAMEPAVRPGDLVLLDRARPGDLAVGDIVAVRDAAGDVLLRRVATRDQKGTTFAYVLEADNRDARMNATDDDVVGEHGRRIPVLGWFLIGVRTLAGKILLAGLCVAGLLLGRGPPAPARPATPVTDGPDVVAYGGEDRPATRETAMSITPAELRHVRFAQVRKGYDTEAVDRALETVADSIEELLHERHELVERVRALETEVERYREVESTLSQTLTLAERAAEELKAEAHAEAERMMAEARAQLAAAQKASAQPATGGGSSMPDPAFIELLGETRAIRSLLQALMTQAPGGNGGTPFTPRAQ